MWYPGSIPGLAYISNAGAKWTNSANGPATLMSAYVKLAYGMSYRLWRKGKNRSGNGSFLSNFNITLFC